MPLIPRKDWPAWANDNQAIKEIYTVLDSNLLHVKYYGDIYDYRDKVTGAIYRSSTIGVIRGDISGMIAATKEDITRGLPVEVDPSGKDPHQPGAKLDAGKLRMDLVLSAFSRALQEVSAIGTFGANKYTANGWLEVPDGIERYSDAMLRHYFKETTEGPMDPDMNLLHAAAVAWNSLARLELMLRKEESC